MSKFIEVEMMARTLMFSDALINALSREIGQAKDAFEVLGKLINALQAEYSQVAEQLSLAFESDKDINKINAMLTAVDENTVSRTVNNFEEIKKTQNDVVTLYQELKDKITPFIEAESSKENTLEREALIANLMEDCTNIIENALPNILKNINGKQHMPEQPPSTGPQHNRP